MGETFERTLFEYAETIRPGELVLVEYTSREPVYLLFCEVLRYAKFAGVPLVIVDVLDGLHVIRTQLKLAGMDTSMIEDATVVKIGGRITTGRVIARIQETTELPIMKRHFVKVLERIHRETGGRPFIRIVVGATELLQQLETDPMKCEEFFASIIRPIVGNPISRGLVFINRKRVMKTGLKEAEELSTRVLRTRIEDGKLIIRVAKSIYFDEYSVEVEVDPHALREHLASKGVENDGGN